MAKIQDIVKVEIKRETNFVRSQNLDKILVVSSTYTGGTPYKIYTDLDAVLEDGYDIDTFEYKSASEIFGQEVAPDYFILTGSNTLSTANDYVNFISSFMGVNDQWLYLITDVMFRPTSVSFTETVKTNTVKAISQYIETTEKFYVLGLGYSTSAP